MKKTVARFLRRIANRIDPCHNYQRIVLGYVPYCNIDNYRSLMLSGAEESAQRLKSRICSLAEMTATADLELKLRQRGLIRMEHNLGTQDRMIDGIKCKAEGLTIVIETNNYWQ